MCGRHGGNKRDACPEPGVRRALHDGDPEPMRTIGRLFVELDVTSLELTHACPIKAWVVMQGNRNLEILGS